MEPENRSLSGPDKVRYIALSGFHETGKTTIANQIVDHLLEKGFVTERRSLASLKVMQMAMAAFRIDELTYKTKKQIFRPFLELYGSLERKVNGDYNLLYEFFDEIYFSMSQEKSWLRKIVVIDDIRFLNQGITFANQVDSLNIQLMPQVSKCRSDLLMTEVELPLFVDHIPGLRQVTAQVDTTWPTVKAIVDVWLLKQSIKNWLNNE